MGTTPGHAGEVGIDIAPVLEAGSLDERVEVALDVLIHRGCALARALTGAEQGALKLWIGEDPTRARKYFSLGAEYAAYSDFRLNPQGLGLHGMAIPPGEVVRLTEDEVINHPEYRNFSGIASSHPPLRGWLAASVCGAGGRVYGLLQLSDKADGAEFDADDEERVRELAGLLGAALDAVRAAAST